MCYKAPNYQMRDSNPNWNSELAVYVVTDTVPESEWLSLPLGGLYAGISTQFWVFQYQKEQQNDGYVKKSHKNDWAAGGADLWGDIKGMMFDCLHNVQQPYVNHFKYLKSVNTKEGNK